MEMRKANQHISHGPFPVIELIDCYHLYCFTTSGVTPSWADRIIHRIQPMLENSCVSAWMYRGLTVSVKQEEKLQYKLCFYAAFSRPTAHSSSAGKTQAQTGPMLNRGRCKDLPVSEPVSDTGFGRNWKSCHPLNILQAHADTAHFSSVTMVL